MLEFDVPGKAQIRRFIVELDQGLVKLVCDGKNIDPANILDIEDKKKDALLSAMSDIAVDILAAVGVVKTKVELIADVEASAEAFKLATAPLEPEPEPEE